MTASICSGVKPRFLNSFRFMFCSFLHFSVCRTATARPMICTPASSLRVNSSVMYAGFAAQGFAHLPTRHAINTLPRPLQGRSVRVLHGHKLQSPLCHRLLYRHSSCCHLVPAMRKSPCGSSACALWCCSILSTSLTSCRCTSSPQCRSGTIRKTAQCTENDT